MSVLSLVLVFLGGAVGSLIRWALGATITNQYPGKFPLGTFVINVSGSFCIGFLATLIMTSWESRYDTIGNSFLLTGFLGGYTTFSSFELDCAKLSESGNRLLSFFYAFASLIGGLIAAFLGLKLAQLC